MDARKSAISCFSIGKTNFTDYHTPYTINGFKDSVTVCKKHDCCCTIRKNLELSVGWRSLERLDYRWKDSLEGKWSYQSKIILWLSGINLTLSYREK